MLDANPCVWQSGSVRVERRQHRKLRRGLTVLGVPAASYGWIHAGRAQTSRATCTLPIERAYLAGNSEG